MPASPGVTVDRGIRKLRLALWIGGVLDLGLALSLGLAPQALAAALYLNQPDAFYSAGFAVTLAALGATSFIAAYAPYGNRRLLRLFVLLRLALGTVLLLPGVDGGAAIASGVGYLLLAVVMSWGLSQSRL